MAAAFAGQSQAGEYDFNNVETYLSSNCVGLIKTFFFTAHASRTVTNMPKVFLDVSKFVRGTGTSAMPVFLLSKDGRSCP